MNEEDLPPSLTRFAAELERALRHELGVVGTRAGRDKRRLRAHPRLLAGTSLGVAGAGAALALALTAASSPPAFAVTQNRDGTYSVAVRYMSAIPAANRRLSGMRLRVALVQVQAECKTSWTVAPPPTPTKAADDKRSRERIQQALGNARLSAQIDPKRIPRGALVMIPAWRVGRQVKMAKGITVKGVTVPGAVPDCMPPVPPPCYHGAVAIAAPGSLGAVGNSGNSGPPPAGNSGDRGGVTPQPPPRPGGNSSNSGNSGNSGGFTYKIHGRPGGEAVAVNCTIHRPGTLPPGAASGNSGNS